MFFDFNPEPQTAARPVIYPALFRLREEHEDPRAAGGGQRVLLLHRATRNGQTVAVPVVDRRRTLVLLRKTSHWPNSQKIPKT